MAIPPIVALEIGTSRVCALVGELREDGLLMATGLGDVKSIGVRKGEIVDFDHALACVRQALQEAEESANLDIRQVHLVVSGAQIRGAVNRGVAHVMNEDREIGRRDMDAAAELARRINLPAERAVLHSIAQRYIVDRREEGVLNPEGMEGFELALDMLIAHAQGNLLRNTIKVAQTVPVEVQDVAYSGLCSSLAVLTPEQKAVGVAVIDLGGGTTNVFAYADQCVAMARSLAVGGEHVTNDVAIGLSLPLPQAERLKCQSGNALVDSGLRARTIRIPPAGGFPGRAVRETDLHQIVHARMDETLEMVRTEIEQCKGLLHKLGAGLVLTGRGARLRGVRELAEQVFHLPCEIGAPRQVSGVAAVSEGPDYAAPVGMLRYAARAGLPARGRWGWFRKLFEGSRGSA